MTVYRHNKRSKRTSKDKESRNTNPLAKKKSTSSHIKSLAAVEDNALRNRSNTR